MYGFVEVIKSLFIYFLNMNEVSNKVIEDKYNMILGKLRPI
jgi:hypothetical protein